MKRFLSVILAAAMLCALFAGCGKSETKDNSTANDTPVADSNKNQNEDVSGTPPADPNKQNGSSDTPSDPNQGDSSKTPVDSNKEGSGKTTPSDIPADSDQGGSSSDTPADSDQGGSSSDTPADPTTDPAADPSAKPIDPNAAVTPNSKPYERGTCDYYSWVSTWANLRFDAPSSYEVNADFLNLPDPENGYREMQAYDTSGSGSYIQVYVYHAQVQAVDEVILQYISELRADITPSNIESIEIGGKAFRYITTTSTFPGASCGAYAVAKEGDYFIHISLSDVSEKGVSKLLNSFSQNP